MQKATDPECDNDDAVGLLFPIDIPVYVEIKLTSFDQVHPGGHEKGGTKFRSIDAGDSVRICWKWLQQCLHVRLCNNNASNTLLIM